MHPNYMPLDFSRVGAVVRGKEFKEAVQRRAKSGGKHSGIGDSTRVKLFLSVEVASYRVRRVYVLLYPVLLYCYRYGGGVYGFIASLTEEKVLLGRAPLTEAYRNSKRFEYKFWAALFNRGGMGKQTAFSEVLKDKEALRAMLRVNALTAAFQVL